MWHFPKKSGHSTQNLVFLKILTCYSSKGTLFIRSFKNLLTCFYILKDHFVIGKSLVKLLLNIYIHIFIHTHISSFQFSSVAQSCPTLHNPMNRSTPGLPVHHQLLEFTHTHAHRAGDAIQPSHPLSSPSPPAPNPSQHQSLFQWVNYSHEVANVLEFQLQHQSFQWTLRTDLL